LHDKVAPEIKRVHGIDIGPYEQPEQEPGGYDWSMPRHESAEKSVQDVGKPCPKCGTPVAEVEPMEWEQNAGDRHTILRCGGCPDRIVAPRTKGNLDRFIWEPGDLVIVKRGTPAPAPAPVTPDTFPPPADFTGSVRRDGATPAGGTYAVLVYVDGKCVEIQEHAADGTMIARAYGAED
jgi:hypothetical protein